MNILRKSLGPEGLPLLPSDFPMSPENRTHDKKAVGTASLGVWRVEPHRGSAGGSGQLRPDPAAEGRAVRTQALCPGKPEASSARLTDIPWKVVHRLPWRGGGPRVKGGSERKRNGTLGTHWRLRAL